MKLTYETGNDNEGAQGTIKITPEELSAAYYPEEIIAARVEPFAAAVLMHVTRDEDGNVVCKPGKMHIMIFCEKGEPL